MNRKTYSCIALLSLSAGLQCFAAQEGPQAKSKAE